MIIVFIGGIGSGKTLSVVKELVDRQHKEDAYINFDTKKIRGVKRIELDWIIKTEKEERQNAKPLITKKVNWQFWNELKKKDKTFSIYLDEVHNILHSRMRDLRKHVEE